MKFLIKYATRGRPEWFDRTIKNILSTISTDDFLVAVTVDTDDEKMMRVIGNYTHKNIRFLPGYSTSKIHAINRDLPMDYPWDILVNMSDDMHFVTHGWDVQMQRAIRAVWPEGTDFFAHFSDGFVFDRLPTMSIMGREYYLRDNYIYHPDYKSFSCDAEAMYVAQMRKRWHYFPHVFFLHQHPANTKAPNDETYRINSLATDHDTKVYWHRLNNYFFEPVNPDTPIPFKEHIGKNL